jgi:hypothetical protein
MNKIVSVIRIAILAVIFTFAVIFLFGEEQGDSMFTFFQTIIDKALAIGAFWFGAKLYKHWCRIDPWLKAYEKMCDEVIEAPNPMNTED